MLEKREKTLPVHQLSNLLLWDLFAMSGRVLIYQTVLKAFLSDEIPSLVDTKDLVLRSDPAREVSRRQHGRRDHMICQFRVREMDCE